MADNVIALGVYTFLVAWLIPKLWKDCEHYVRTGGLLQFLVAVILLIAVLLVAGTCVWRFVQ